MSERFKYTATQLIKKNMSKLNIDNIDDFVDFISINIERDVKKYEEAGKKALKDIRCKAMSTWLTTKQSGRYVAYESAIRFDKTLIKQNNDATIDITIRSYIDTQAFEKVFASTSQAYQSIYDWIYETRSYDDPNKHVGHISDGWYGTIYNGNKPTDEHFKGSAIAMPYSIGEYVLNNMWVYGYSALPSKEEKTGTHWVNGKFTARQPLYKATEANLNENWNKRVREFINK